ncbi:MAG: hypothetical protein BHW30_05410 [Firmicutes bacterium CAG_194_44_15]|nr:MAG: hypothetical protein BHW30_05410 [Firmicutes bacterium CAG_194_44_15]
MQTLATSQQTLTETISAKRGNIYDSNGNTTATLQVVGNQVIPEEQVNRINNLQYTEGMYIGIETKYPEKLSITRKGENPYLRPCAWVMQQQKAEEYPAVKKITYGEGVRWLQWELCEAGYPVSVDGIFGTETKAALQKFQISCELCPDGIAKFEEQGKL